METCQAGPFAASELAEKLGATLEGGGDASLSGVLPLDQATPEHLSFLDNQAYKSLAEETKAGAVLVRPQDAELLPKKTLKIILDNPYVGFAKALQLFYPDQDVQAGISAQAIVSQSAAIDPTARLEPGVVVYPNAKIGAGAHIGAHTVIGEGVEIGTNTKVGSSVTLLKAKIGQHCLIHSGVRIGQDGFGFAQDGATLVKVPQVGGVVIGDDVEIGANTTIDCGALADTVIGDMTKIDCQVQIGHNVKLGKGCRVVAQVGLAGSSTFGDGVVIGGQSGVAGHIQIADYVMIAGRSGVTKSIDTPKTVVAGFPAMPIQQWRRLNAHLARMLKQSKKANKGAADAE